MRASGQLGNIPIAAPRSIFTSFDRDVENMVVRYPCDYQVRTSPLPGFLESPASPSLELSS